MAKKSSEGMKVKGASGAAAKLEQQKSQVADLVRNTRRPSMSGRTVELALEGRSNEYITEVLRKEFKLPPHHNHYAAWYRQAFVRKLKAQLADMKGAEKQKIQDTIDKVRATASERSKAAAKTA